MNVSLVQKIKERQTNILSSSSLLSLLSFSYMDSRCEIKCIKRSTETGRKREKKGREGKQTHMKEKPDW